MKAILITRANQSELAGQYEVDTADEEELLPIGYYLVASFGEEHYDVLSPDNWKAAFIEGMKLQNGYVEALKVD